MTAGAIGPFSVEFVAVCVGPGPQHVVTLVTWLWSCVAGPYPVIFFPG